MSSEKSAERTVQHHELDPHESTRDLILLWVMFLALGLCNIVIWRVRYSLYDVSQVQVELIESGLFGLFFGTLGIEALFELSVLLFTFATVFSFGMAGIQTVTILSDQ